MAETELATYRHLNGCGGPAFRYEKEWAVQGEPVVVSRARLLDGTRPIYGDEMLCGTCHENVGPLSIAYFEL